MRQYTKKRAAANRIAQGTRRSLVAQHEDGGCWVCGYSSKRPNPALPLKLSKLCCHELGACNGGLRGKSQGDARFLLVVCFWCNQHEVGDKSKWPEVRQLALKLARDPETYDLLAYLKHTRPAALERISEADVASWLSLLPVRRFAGRYQDWRTL